VYVDRFNIGLQDFNYEVRLNGRDFYFFNIINHGDHINSNNYFSILNIYDSIRQLDKSIKDLVISTIEKGLSETTYVIYENTRFEMRMFNLQSFPDNVNILVDEVNILLTKTMYLLALIQEKSRSLFERKEKNHKYSNGLLNLLIVLLRNTSNHPILQSKGWSYNTELLKYEFKYPDMDAVIVEVNRENRDICSSYLESIIRMNSKDEISASISDLSKRINEECFHRINYQNPTKHDFKYREVIDVIQSKVKKGLYDIDEEDDDLSECYSKEFHNISGNSYIYIVLSKPSIQKYYLTDQEKGDILQIGI
jgi:hypothetical protein